MYMSRLCLPTVERDKFVLQCTHGACIYFFGDEKSTFEGLMKYDKVISQPTRFKSCQGTHSDRNVIK